MTSHERIAQAVADGMWQAYRISMKGEPTQVKINMLRDYYDTNAHYHIVDLNPSYYCDVCIRIDNYIKALCRGGQLYPGESLLTMRLQLWKPKVKR